jgi:hypothetical protein
LTPVQLSGTASITTIAESAGSVVTLTTVGNPFSAGSTVEVSGLSAGTWLNGYTVSLLTANAAGTTITFNDPTSHGTLASTSLTGTPVLTQVSGISALTIVESGVGGGTVVVSGGAGLATQSAGTTGAITAQNTTTATVSTTNSSPNLQLEANYWTGTRSRPDIWAFGFSLAAGTNGLSTLNINHTGSTSDPYISFQQAGTELFAISLITANTAYLLNDQTNGIVAVQGNISTNSNTAGTTGFSTQILGRASGFTGTTAGGQQGPLQVSGTFSPTTGTTNFYGLQVLPTINQVGSTGNYFGIYLNAVETALGGTANKLLTLQAGSTGGTTKFEINNSGVADTYAGIATVRNGMPAEYAKSDLTAQSAAITATTLYATTATGAYRVAWSAAITTASDGSSVLGGTGGFQVLYTSPTDSVVKTTVSGNSVTSSANTTGTAVGGDVVIYAKTGTNIQYTYGYTSVQTTTAMAYEIHVTLESL